MVLNVYARPLIPLALSFMVGIVGGLFLAGFEPAVLVGLAAAFGFTVFCLLRRRNESLSPLLIFIFLGYLSVQPWMAPRFPADHIIHFTGQQKWHITGTVDSRPVPRSNRLKFPDDGRTDRSRRRLPAGHREDTRNRHRRRMRLFPRRPHLVRKPDSRTT